MYQWVNREITTLLGRNMKLYRLQRTRTWVTAGFNL